MARFGDPEDWRYVFIVGRAFKKWNQTTMAQEAGIDPSRYSDYEWGERVPSPRIRKQIARAWGVDDSFLEWLLPLCRNIRLGFERAVGAAQPKAQPEPESPSRRVSHVASFVDAAIAPFLLELDHLESEYVPSSDDRLWAEEQWKGTESLKAEDQILVVENLQDERSWALAELLCEASVEAVADRADEALRLALLAVQVADRSPGPETRRCHLLGYCQDFKANALRVGGDLSAAKTAFKKADDLWKQGAGSDLMSMLDANRRLDLKASLYMNDGRHEEALTCIDQALEKQRHETEIGKLLLIKARALELGAKYEQALETLQQAEPRIEGKGETRLLCVLMFNRAVCFCHLDLYSEAEPLLTSVRTLAGGKGLDRIRVRWLEGRTWLGLGRREDALAALTEVRQYFQTEQIDYDFALVSLELAVLHLEEGRTQLVRELAEEMFWIFERQKVHKEALAALTLFRRAVQLEEARAEWTRRLIKYLYQAQHNPGLRFEA